MMHEIETLNGTTFEKEESRWGDIEFQKNCGGLRHCKSSSVQNSEIESMSTWFDTDTDQSVRHYENW